MDEERVKEAEASSFLVTEKLGVLMKKYALPCIISLLVAALYNIVDQIFIANADYLGSYGNAANTVIFPLTVVALAIAVMIGDGCCAFVSINLGGRNRENAHRSIGNSIVLCVVASLLITIFYFAFQNQILEAFGGKVNQETFAYSKEYFRWITAGMPFYMFGQAMNPVIRSDGSPKFAMASTLAGAVVNLILDPVFIFGFRWGNDGSSGRNSIGTNLDSVSGFMVSVAFKICTVEKKQLLFERKYYLSIPLFRCLQLFVTNFIGSCYGSH